MVLNFFSITAQEPIEVALESRPSSQGIQPAFEVVVPQATTNDAVKLWENTIISRSLFTRSPKMKKEKDEWVVRDIVIDDITSEPLDVYAQVSSFTDNIYVRLFFRDKDGFIGSSGSSQQVVGAAKQFVRNYGVDLYRLAVENELKEEEKQLQSLESNLNKMQRKNRSFNKKVNKAERAEGNLSNDLKDNQDILKGRRGADVEITSEEAREELEKEIKSNQKEIRKAKREQSKFDRKISRNEKEQAELEDEISEQRSRIATVKARLNNIR